MSTPSVKLKSAGKETASPGITSERAAWGDAWGNDPREPMPSAMTAWIADCRINIGKALCGREVQRKCILAGLGQRNKGGPITEQQQEEIVRRLARGDQLRQLATDWQVRDQAACTTGRVISLEQATVRPRRLAYLATLELVPAPPAEARAYMGTAPKRVAVDLHRRMEQAAEMVASGETW
jgi:hypothetical protein